LCSHLYIRKERIKGGRQGGREAEGGREEGRKQGRKEGRKERRKFLASICLLATTLPYPYLSHLSF
jgi:flagellar biosynthesis/type III secretory pathway protein FliH